MEPTNPSNHRPHRANRARCSDRPLTRVAALVAASPFIQMTGTQWTRALHTRCRIIKAIKAWRMLQRARSDIKNEHGRYLPKPWVRLASWSGPSTFPLHPQCRTHQNLKVFIITSCECDEDSRGFA